MAFRIVRSLQHRTSQLNEYTQISHRTFASPVRYSKPMRYVHWAVAGGVLSVFALVETAKRTKDKSLKGTLMHYHKSIGVLTFGFISLRVGLRAISKIPAHMPGPIWQQSAGALSHYALYGCMLFMPISGIAMGYFGGKGVPFFWTKIPAADEPNKKYAKWAYQNHKRMGTVFECLVALHVAAAGYHMMKGDRIFDRISPFAGVALVSILDDEDYQDEFKDDDDF